MSTSQNLEKYETELHVLMNIFFELAVIDFESGNIEHQELKNRYYQVYNRLYDEKFVRLYFENEKNFVYKKSNLYKLWRLIWRLTPNYYFWDYFLTKYLGGSINIGNATFFGYNAMFWAIEIRTLKGYWFFRPPCFLILGGRGWTWGKLYFSPNGILSHPEAIRFYGDKV